MQREKYSIYMARASHAEEQAARTTDVAAKAVLLRAAKEYRDAAKEAQAKSPEADPR